MVQARNASKAARRPALRQRLSDRRQLPRPSRRAALVLPYADADMMRLHLDEISRNVAEEAHAVLLLDRAGWHTTGKLDVLDRHHADLPTFPRPGAEPGRDKLWQYLPPELAPQAPSSKTTTRSSTPHAPLGESSSLNTKRSPPSECATGLTSVSRY